MAEIIKSYRQNVGAARFIGKRYGDADRVDGMFGAKWGDWFENGWFDIIEAQIGENPADAHEDSGAYIGLMREADGKFEYYIGIFAPESMAVPDGFVHIDFPAGELGVCWVYGKDGEVYGLEGDCWERLEGDAKDKLEISGGWCFERYGCPRFTAPDEHGNIILDICFYLK